MGGAAATALAACVYSLAPAPATEPAALSVTAPTPPPVPPPPPPQPETVAAPVPAEGLLLYGVSGGGRAGMAALIGRPGGGQRLVPLGREYRPGLKLAELGGSYAVLTSAGVSTRLELGGSGSTIAASSPPPAAASGAMDSADLRVGMAPRRNGGRIDGFALKPGANLAPLLRAGLRPGDVLVAVNGQPFDSGEKLLELPREIAGSYTAEFEFERAGRRMKAALPVNSRKES